MLKAIILSAAAMVALSSSAIASTGDSVTSGRGVTVHGPIGPSICASGSTLWFAKGKQILVSRNQGKTWHVSLSRALRGDVRFWSSSLECSGRSAWVFFWGHAGQASQMPEVVYRTENGGRSWRAIADESLFESFYYPKADSSYNVGSYPAPYQVVNPSTAFFLGLSPATGMHGAVLLTMTNDGGRTMVQRRVSCLWDIGATDLSFQSGTKGWIEGTCDGHESILTTTDGGRTFSRHRLPGR